MSPGEVNFSFPRRPVYLSSLGIVAVLLGTLAVAHYGTELTRYSVLPAATPEHGTLPAADCPADELEEEGLSRAECRQMLERVRSLLVSAPPWYFGVAGDIAAAGVLASLLSLLPGAALVAGRPVAGTAAVAFGAVTAVHLAWFIAAVNAGPLLRDLYLWNALTWFALHLGLTMAAAAGWRTMQAAPTRSAAEDRVAHRPVEAQDLDDAGGARPYSTTAIVCHALIALSVLFLFASSWWMLALPLPSAELTYRAFPFQLHKNLGLTLVIPLGLLLYARLRRPPSPPAARHLPPVTYRLVVADHVALYLLILLVAGSGYMSSSYSGWGTTLWWLVDLPHWGYEHEALNQFWSDVHLWTCWALLLVVAVHVAGALYHAFRGDGLVARMLRL